MDLEQTLEQFDAVETNLRRLEKVWEEMQQLIPGGPAFYGNSPENLRFRELQRSFASILKGIPPLDGYSISEITGDLDSIGQARLDALEIGEFEAKIWIEDKIDEPTREIAEYRFRFRDARRDLVRGKLQELVAEINQLVISLAHSARIRPASINQPTQKAVDQSAKSKCSLYPLELTAHVTVHSNRRLLRAYGTSNQANRTAS